MSIISQAKEIADLIKKIGDVELYRKIVELEGEIIELTRQNRALEDKLGELQKHAEVIASLRRHGSFYVRDGDADPFCSYCVEVNRLAVHVLFTGQLEARRRVWHCPHCKNKTVDTRND